MHSIVAASTKAGSRKRFRPTEAHGFNLYTTAAMMIMFVVLLCGQCAASSEASTTAAPTATSTTELSERGPLRGGVITGGANCPYNPCTPQRLGCRKLFRNEIGCLLCKCENFTSNLNRACQLHGCTVELLQCAGSRLKISPEGCTLCQCEDEGATTTRRILIPNSSKNSIVGDLPIIAASYDDETGPTTTTMSTPALPRITCPDIECTAEDLGCEQLVVNPLTGCTQCECSTGARTGIHLTNSQDRVISSERSGDTVNPCPSPSEILEGPEMSQGVNKMTKKKYKYKLSIGKLKRGFEPDKSYKISLKASKRAPKFRAFLFTVRPAPHVSGDSGNAAGVNVSECEAGVLSDPILTSKRKKSGASGSSGGGEPIKHVRPIPHCFTQAIEANHTTNKSVAHAEWRAPHCGCVYISVAVVDDTNRVGYLDEAFLTGEEITTKINRPLIRTVCAKSAKSSSKRKKTKVSQRQQRPSWLSAKCCYDAYVKSGKKSVMTPQECKSDAVEYTTSRKLRFKVFRITCSSTYAKCCMMSPKVQRQGGNRLPTIGKTEESKKKPKKGGKGGGKGRKRPKKVKKVKKGKKNKNGKSGGKKKKKSRSRKRTSQQ